MYFRFNPRQAQFFHQQMNQPPREQLIQCSDGVYRPASMVEEFENSNSVKLLTGPNDQG